MLCVAASARTFFLWCAVVLLAAPPLPAYSQGLPTINLVPYISNLTTPLSIAHAGDGSQRLFLVEQGGATLIIKGQTVAPAAVS